MHDIFTTIGSKEILKQLINNNPQRKMFLYQGRQDFQIVDPFSDNSIFTIPIKHQVIKTYQDINWQFDKNDVTLSVSDDEKKLLLNKVNELMDHPQPLVGLLLTQDDKDANRITITTFWKDLADCMKWYRSSELDFVTYYQKIATSNYYPTNYNKVSY